MFQEQNDGMKTEVALSAYSSEAAPSKRTNKHLPKSLTEKLLNVDDVAEFLDMSPKSVRRSISKRELAFYRIGRRVLVSREQLESYLQKREVLPYDAAEAVRRILSK